MLHRAREIAYRKLTHLNFRRRQECLTLLRWLDAQPGERILDIGSGDGWWDHRIARAGCTVVGVDINEKALAIAGRRNRTERTEFHAMNAEELDFGDASFDRAISMCAIEHFHREDRVLENISRVLKPGGRFVLSADSLTNPELSARERDDHRRRYAVNTFYTIDVLRHKLDAAGFDLEHAEYILTTPLTLGLARLSWRMDDLADSRKPVAGAIGEVVNALIHTVGKVASDLSEGMFGRSDTGLTILARARKRGTPPG